MTENIKEVKIQKPEDRITVTVKGASREILMSAGLVRRLSAYVGSMDNVGAVYMEPALQIALIEECLRDRHPSGAAKDPADVIPDLDKYELSTDDGDRLASWIGGHVTHFFINGALMMKNNLEDPMKTLQTLMSSLTGMAASLTSKPSAGPTESVQAA